MIDESMPPRLEGRAGAWRMLGPEMTSPPALYLSFWVFCGNVYLFISQQRGTGERRMPLKHTGVNTTGQDGLSRGTGRLARDRSEKAARSAHGAPAAAHGQEAAHGPSFRQGLASGFH